MIIAEMAAKDLMPVKSESMPVIKDTVVPSMMSTSMFACPWPIDLRAERCVGQPIPNTTGAERRSMTSVYTALPKGVMPKNISRDIHTITGRVRDHARIMRFLAARNSSSPSSSSGAPAAVASGLTS